MRTTPTEPNGDDGSGNSSFAGASGFPSPALSFSRLARCRQIVPSSFSARSPQMTSPPLQKSQTKLTATPSSLLHSPRVRSSIHSLSTVDEEFQNKSHKPVFVNNAPNHFSPLAGLAIFFLTLFLLFFFYLREEIPVLGNFLIAPVAIIVAAFAARTGSVVRRITLVSSFVFKHSWEERNRKPVSSPFLSSSSV